MPTLNWIGKDKVVKHHHDVPFRVLNHQYTFPNTQGDESISENKIIHGDNLEALKALLPYYEGKIKCIYIDPPYNTGNEGWVYNDNVNDPKMKKWLGKVVGKEAEDLTRHDKWLCMMYPRLKLLHKLLAPDGAIFVSIDDNEQASLKLLMDEIWGGGNFVNNIIWEKKFSPQNDAKYLSDNHDFIVVYAKSLNNWQRNLLHRTEEQNLRYKNLDNDERGVWTSGDLLRKDVQRTGLYTIITPAGRECSPPAGTSWRVPESRYTELVNENRVWFGKDGNGVPRIKRFLEDVQQGIVPVTIWTQLEVGHNQEGKQELKRIFNESNTPFDTPKPPRLIEKILQIATDKNSIILDSFAGSGTTAQAVLNLNKADGGNRKFILVEMEDYAETITAERVKRVINGYGNVEGTGGDFNYYELGESLFDEDRNLNENLPVATLRDYIWYVETKDSLPLNTNEFHQQPYFLDKYQETAYFFIYEKEHITTLDYDFLEHVNIQAEQYVMYADNCTLSEAFRREKHIIFKKIPRDISRF
jgi:adenine-specific DNA-methyltransferase